MAEQHFEFEYNDYPLIPVRFFSKTKKTPLIDALLDSGGDFIVIPQAIAKYLQLKLKDAGFVDTAGGEANLYKSQVKMVIENKNNNYIYEDLEIHISDRNDIPVLLGRKPIFEDHNITFKKYENKLILNNIKK